MITPIETHYKGYRFRSRLEARWAVFFDAINFKWEYEVEGYSLDGLYYLPDFWLPEGSVFVEVKPNTPSSIELEKARRLAIVHPVIIAIGLPDSISYPMFFPHPDPSIKEILQWFILFDWHKNEKGNFKFLFKNNSTREDGWLPDYYHQACNAARSARFEHGERVMA